MQVTPTLSRMTDLDPTRTYLVRAPQTHHSSHRDNFTNPTFLFRCTIIHSSILMHAFIHSFIHSFIHPYIHPIHPSIAYAIIAPQRFASRHKMVVIAFDMSTTDRGSKAGLRRDRGRLVSNRARGEKMRWAPAALPEPARKRAGTSRPFSFDSNLEPSL